MKTLTKVVSFLLVALMMISLLPMSVFAASDFPINSTPSTDGYYNLISQQDWGIAPGISESEIVLNNDAGDRRQVVHLMEADISNPYTRVISSYTNMNTKEYAISTIPEHAAFIENEWGENVVGAMNTCLSWYNSAAYSNDPSRVNEPLGFMMVDGEVYFDHSVGFPTCIVIHKDINDAGETRPTNIPKVEMRTVTDSSCLNGWEDQVIPCSSGFIVKDGVNQYKAAHDSNTAARSVVGVKADGSIVIMMNDGRQAPYSLGMNMYECAEVMIAAGCVYAANCDGGGSSTFMSQRPGQDLEVNCSPCDGSLRQNTHGIIFISTAPATGEFYNAYLQTENDYFVPYSKVEIEAIGRDFSGAEAEIPVDAVWSLNDDSFGTVENGVFTSNGKTGEVVINLSYNGEIVGSKTIYIVNPDSVAFAQSSTVIPYGKNIVMDITATYGAFEVSYKADDFEWVLSDANAGTRDGLSFTATTDTTKTGVTVTATYKYADMGSTTLNIKFGQGSQIIYDFENGDISNWLGIDAAIEWAKKNNTNSPLLDDSPLAGNFSKGNDSTTFLATADNGKVKNGQYALGVELDYTHSGSFGQWAYNMFFNVEGQTVLRDVANGKNATRLGMWIYIPEELAPGHNLAMQAELYCGSSSTNYARKNTHLILECNGKTLTNCSEADIPEDRWVYCYMDLTGYNYVSLQNPYESLSTRREPQFIRFYTQSKEPFNAVFYFDDITLDYSDAVDDRNAPVISDILVSTSGTTIRSFSAKVADYVANNASGLDTTSAKIYVDGVAIEDATCNGSTISSPDVTLLPGAHTVTFEIADKMGNVTKESQKFVVSGTAPVTFAGHNDLNNVPQYDSVYYLDIKTDNIETISSLVTEVYLNFANTWELDHMIVADGFDATYVLNENNNVATITVTKTGDTSTGSETLVSIPVRVWSWNADAAGFESSAIGGNSYPKVSVKTDVRKGFVAFTDGTEGTFDGDFTVDTAVTDTVVPSAWHVHDAKAVDNLAATCTKDGYVGRTYCAVCGSVVDWGTVDPATGHNWEVNEEGKLYCINGGELFNGVYTDGKTYFDGVVVSDGWNSDNTAYYEDGVKLTGSHIIDGVMCTFDENGVYLADYLYDGFYEVDDTVMYFTGNHYLTGSQRISSDYYNFYDNGLAYDGEVVINGITCLFDNGLSVATDTVRMAGICGETAQFVLTADGTMYICGSGDTTDYFSIGSNPWYATERRNIKVVNIGKDITSLGRRAFQNCPYLHTVNFEEGSQLKSIHTHAFTTCPRLTTITFPEGLEVIESAAFYDSLNFTYMYMPDSLTSIHSYTFGETKPENLVMDVVRDSVAHQYAKYHKVNYTIRTTLVESGNCGDNVTWKFFSNGLLEFSGSGAINDYSYLKYGEDAAPWALYRSDITNIVIGADVTAIGTYAFYNCTALQTVEFAEGSKLETIGVGAFGYCGFTSVTLPASLKTIGNTAFYFSKLETVEFEAESELKTIGDYAFRNCESLTSLYIPQGVTRIGAAILYKCENAVMSVVKDTYSNKYATSNGYAVIYRVPEPVVIYNGTCGDTTTFALYDNGTLKIDGSGAIKDYSYLKYGEDAAPWTLYRSDIKKIVIGADVTAIGTYAFYNCTALQTVEFAEGSKLETIGVGAFGYCGFTSVTLPASLKTIGNTAFYFSKLETVEFEAESELKTIGDYAFRNCESLTSLYIPQGVSKIGVAILYKCENAVMSVVKDTYSNKYATSNGYAVIYREPEPVVIYNGTCGDTTTFALYDNGTLKINGSGAIKDYSYLKYGEDAAPWTLYRSDIKKIVIGADVTAIGTYAFYNCTALQTVEFAEGSKLETIGEGAFGYCGFTSVTLPASLKTIGNTAFYFSKLETVEFEAESELKTIGDYAFRNCESLTSLYVPKSVTDIGIAILYKCTNATVSVANNSYAMTFVINNGYNYIVR